MTTSKVGTQGGHNQDDRSQSGRSQMSVEDKIEHNEQLLVLNVSSGRGGNDAESAACCSGPGATCNIF